MNSREKGKRGELELAEELRRHGVKAFRGQQFCGLKGNPDVVVEDWPDLHVECKRSERLVIDNAMEQAIRDAKDKTPVVIHRRNRGQWLVTARLHDFVTSARAGALLTQYRALLTQYQNDLRFPNIDNNQRQRRLAAIEAVLGNPTP